MPSKINTQNQIEFIKPIVILEYWAFTIILILVTISGLFLLRDLIFSTFGIIGGIIIPTPTITTDLHITSGVALTVLGLLHFGIHFTSKNKDILPKDTLQDFKTFLHAGMYLIFFSRKENYPQNGRYNGRQRITYIALVYILGLSIITGFLMYGHIIGHELTYVHATPGGVAFMVLLFHFLIHIKNRDWILLKSSFFTGKIPAWYARKNYPVWYKEVKNKKFAPPSKNLFLYWWR